MPLVNGGWCPAGFAFDWGVCGRVQWPAHRSASLYDMSCMKTKHKGGEGSCAVVAFGINGRRKLLHTCGFVVFFFFFYHANSLTWSAVPLEIGVKGTMSSSYWNSLPVQGGFIHRVRTCNQASNTAENESSGLMMLQSILPATSNGIFQSLQILFAGQVETYGLRWACFVSCQPLRM